MEVIMGVDHKRTYVFCIKYCFHINSYKYGSNAILCGYMW
jgi:hypothetical protein